MTSQIELSREGSLGVIALNRPEAINALSLAMIDAVRTALAGWAGDDEVRAVLFEARGPRGFCAGGDVRAIRAAVLDGNAAAADHYFAAEYAMNLEIARFAKPTVVIAPGIVMGGGIGIAGHCRYRFTTTEARFAMPEAAIGFFCDVGVNAILATVPAHRALLFELSGQTVGAGDALALGLTDCVVAPAGLAALRQAIVAAAAAPDAATALSRLVGAETVPLPGAPFCALADTLASCVTGTDAAQIIEAVFASKQAPELAELLSRRSPTSQAAILAAHLRARQLPDIAEVLAADLRLAGLLARQPDFAEGVRSVLVDKDHRPDWQAVVPFAEIEARLAG